MVQSNHPSYEELLLWHSGELSPEQATVVKTHLGGCKDCASQIDEITDICEDVNWVSTEAAQRGLRSAISSKKRRRFVVGRQVAAGIAAALIVSLLLLFTFSDLTPEARADSLLSKAIREETAAVSRRRLVHFKSGPNQCQWTVGADGSQSSPAAFASSSFCGLVSANLQSAGWTDPLSARSFQRWRTSLKKKRDTIAKAPEATEVTTSTQEGPLRSATLRVRISDYRPVAVRFQFADSSGAEQRAVDITEEEEVPQQVAEFPAPVEPKTPAPTAPVVPAVIDPMDETEARVRLTLHRLGVDTNVLLAVERTGNGVRVWGVVPTAETKSTVFAALSASPDVEVNVLSETEEAQQQAPLPWTAAHGDSSPLDFDQIRTLFSDNSAGRQEFLNGLDAVTRRLAGEARSRDALLALASRLRSSEQEEPLQKAAADLDSRMAVDTSLLANQLQPLTGKISGRAKRLSYPQAMELYTLVHDVAFQSRSREPLALDDALARVRALLVKG
jgi:hypothetical protein